MQVGDKITFTPKAWTEKSGTNAEMIGSAYEVTGTIVEINRARRWYRVMYTVHGATNYECFKF